MFANYFIIFFVFLLGLCMGSFLNCVIYRLEQGKTLKGRSFCPHCKSKLSWLDLFPVFSFLFLLGKCRYCHKKISWQYPLVELTTGILFVLIFWSFGFDLTSRFGIWDLIAICFMFYVSCSMIVIFVYDLKYYIIPDKVLLPAIVITVVYRIFEFGFALLFNRAPGRMTGWIFSLLGNYLLAVIIASGFFLIIFLISRGRWMGFGDVKLAVLMGLLLGLSNVLAALFLAFFFGAIIGIIAMIFEKKSLKSEMPFGPFLIAGTFIAMFWGSWLINWYMHLFII